MEVKEGERSTAELHIQSIVHTDQISYILKGMIFKALCWKQERHGTYAKVLHWSLPFPKMNMGSFGLENQPLVSRVSRGIPGSLS